MLTLPSLACPANTLRGQIKHSWIENRLLSKTEDDVVRLWREGGWRTLERECQYRIKQARALVDDMEQGFSPSQLVEHLKPLADLPEDKKRRIQALVHAAYLERYGIADLRDRLRQARTELEGALDRMRAGWSEPVSEEAEPAVRMAWREVERRAATLRGFLEKLPRGISLP